MASSTSPGRPPTPRLSKRHNWFRPGAKLLLDLGTVKDLAEVSVNGKGDGDAVEASVSGGRDRRAKAGANQLEIKVTNQWSNRQMGDRLGPPESACCPRWLAS